MTAGTEGVAPRRIALISSSYHPYFGGVEEHVRQVARELSKLGHTVEVWTVDRGEHLGVQELDGTTVRYLPTPLPSFTPRGVLAFLRQLLPAAPAWWRAFRAFRPDVLNVQCFGPNGVYASVLARATHTPLVVSSHGETFTDEHDVFGTTRLMPWALRRALAQAAAVTGCSDVVVDDLRGRFGLRGGTVIPNGVSLPAETEPLGDTAFARPYVFAVGRMVHVKGFDTLIRAFAAADLPDYTLVIGGDGPEREALRRLGDELQLGERLILPGRLSQPEVFASMSGAEMVVVPSRREAFGIVVLEAWLSGTPLIATRSGGPDSLIVDGVSGLLVPPDDVHSLALRLEGLAQRQEEGARLSSNGLASVREFTWGRVAVAYSDCMVMLSPRHHQSRRAHAA